MKNSFFHIRPAYVIKTLVWAVYAVVLISTTSSFLYSAGYRGAVPDLVLCATISLSYFESEKTAAVFGMLAGFTLEAVGSVGFGILPLFYMMCGCVSALLFVRVLQKHFGSYMLYTAVFMLVRMGISIIYIQFAMPDFSIQLAFEHTLITEYVLTLISAVPIFFITRIISRWLDTSRDTQDVKM